MSLVRTASATAAPTPVLDAAFGAALRLFRQGKYDAARRHFLRILERVPAHAESLHHLALIAWREGKTGTAIELLTRAAKADPTNARYLRLIGEAFHQTGQQENAARAFALATRLDPDDAEAWHYLGVTLHALRRWEEAEAASQRAIALAPGNADAYQNLALVCSELRRFDAAAELLRKTLSLAPTSFGAWYNLANQLLATNRYAEAVDAFRRAIALAPDHPDPHINLAFALLTMGALEEGWREYEWRWQGAAARKHARPAAIPRWDGRPSPRSILLQMEQGFGDSLQFSRYAPLVAARGHAVTLEVQPELVTLLQRSFAGAGVTVVPRAADFPGLAGLPRCDAACQLMSLPHLFGTTLATIPAAPYLSPDPAKAALWRERLADLPAGPRVGLVWAGNPSNNRERVDVFRSMPFRALAPLFAIEGVSFVSLQKEAAAAQLAAAPDLACRDLAPHLTDFAETAAALSALDLVICVDTAVAHLAGAIGKDVWMLSRFNGCWRWLADRADSPWYPSMRIFRQDAGRNWEPVVANVAAALRTWRQDRQRAGQPSA